MYLVLEMTGHSTGSGLDPTTAYPTCIIQGILGSTALYSRTETARQGRKFFCEQMTPLTPVALVAGRSL